MIELMKKEDLESAALIAQENFSGMKDSERSKNWIRCNLCAYPRMQYFVSKVEGEIAGYVLWVEKGGFREIAVWELEQIAVKKDYQGQGIGKSLIKESLYEIKNYLSKRNSSLKLIEVTTGVESKAQKIYEDVLGAKVESVIKDFFGGDEALMIARFE